MESSNNHKAVLQANIERLSSTRFNLLTTTVALLNRHLSRLFLPLTNGGSLRLELAANNSILDHTGISISVKMPADRWTDFERLSGGQQSVSALAVSLSLSLAFPTPILIADEVDAALDTLAVGRVQKVFHTLTKSSLMPRQVLVVSLREQMYEHCSRIIGVYNCKGSSRVVHLDCDN
ncbi:hypothetical protein GEMRC1_001572 [Eukaryota sp. GEM-RC1]